MSKARSLGGVILKTCLRLHCYDITVSPRGLDFIRSLIQSGGDFAQSNANVSAPAFTRNIGREAGIEF